MWTYSYEAELLIACFHEFMYLLIVLHHGIRESGQKYWGEFQQNG